MLAPATSARLRPRMRSAAGFRSAIRDRRSRMMTPSPTDSIRASTQGGHRLEELVAEHGQRRDHGRAREQKRCRVDDRFVAAQYEHDVACPGNDRANHQQPSALLV